MLSRLAIFISSLLLSASLFGQTLTSTVDRNQMTANQTLKLIVSYDGSTRTEALDLSAVQQDFDVLSNSSGTSLQMINGQSSRTTTWELLLIPKRTGNLVIPSFSLGNIFSEAVQIKVLDASQVADTDESMTVELTLDRNNVRVGEQVLVSIKLRAQANLADLAGEQLKLENAEIQLVDQQDYSELHNGVSWRVIEWTYAVFPQTGGTLAIPKQMFTASLQNNARRRSFFDSFASRGQRVAARSESAVIQVAAAAENEGDWFPASNVTLSASWTSEPSTLTVGEPLTRIVEIRAESQLSAAIPPLATANQTTYKEYKDQPALENIKSGKGIVGVRKESSAIVPSQEGILEFPEQIIRWWDINANQWREAILPAESYEVSPAILDQSFSPPANFETAPVFGIDGAQTSELAGNPTTVSESIWKWVTIALFIVVVGQAFLLIRRPSIAVVKEEKKASETSESEKTAWSDLSLALKSEDPARIRNQLLVWSKARWPKDTVHSLDALAARSKSEEFLGALHSLDLILFKGHSGKLSSATLKKELQTLRALDSKPEETSALAPLYPQSL